MAVDIYTRRVSKQQFDNGWFDTEFGNIQRAFNTLVAPSTITEANISLSDLLTDDVTIARHGFAPKLPNDATKFLNGVGGYTVPTLLGTVVQSARLQSDVSTAGGTYITSLLTLPVLNGESWAFRWVLALGTSVGATQGISFQIVAPTNHAHFGVENSIRSAVAFSQPSSATPIVFATGVANGDFSGSPTWAIIDASFDTFTAGGTVDLQFKNLGGGSETAIIRQASTFTAVRTGP